MRKCTKLMLAVVAFLLIATMTAIPAYAIKVYVNPSIQTGNYSPDGAYNEGNSMQDVANRLMTKLIGRGFDARNSGWLDLGPACSDANSWGADCFVALHTDSTGSGGWVSNHGTRGFFHQTSGGWHDDRNVDFAGKIAAKMTEQFNHFGRGYNLGTQADYPWCGWNMYVLAPWNQDAIPSALMEGLYHDNYDDVYKVLLDEAGREGYAEGVFRGICDYYGWNYMELLPMWGPICQAQDTKLEFFVRGSDGNCWHRWQTAPGYHNWNPYENLGKGSTNIASTIATAINSDGRIELVMRGADNNLYHRWQTSPNGGWSSGWSSFGNPGVALSGNPVCAVTSDKRIEIYVRGSDGNCWHLFWKPEGGWSAWENMGKPSGVNLTGDATVMQAGDDKLEMFWVGSDGKIWHRWQTAPGYHNWNAWENLGNGGVTLTGSPTSCRSADGRIEFFVRGTDGNCWHKWQTAPNSGWSAWENMGKPGANLASDGCIVKNQSGEMEFFFIGSDGNIWHRWQSGPGLRGWEAWENLGSGGYVLTGNPHCSYTSDGRVEIYAKGTDGNLWHKFQTRPNGGWSAWENMGQPSAGLAEM